MSGKWVARVLVPSSYFSKKTDKTMTPKTKQGVDREIERLKGLRDELPDEDRPAGEGWSMGVPHNKSVMRLNRMCVDHGACHVVLMDNHGLHPVADASDALDGIAHDDKGRIKVVGYVCAEELRERISEHVQFPGHYIRSIIDELAG